MASLEGETIVHRPGELVAEVAVTGAAAGVQPMRAAGCADGVLRRFLLLDYEPVCDQAPVAPPRYRFRAHHGDPPAPRKREQPAHAAAELWRAHVVRVVAKACVAPARVRPRVLRFRPPASELRDGLILDAGSGESSPERRLAEVRESAGAAQLAYVGEQSNTILSKQGDELRERARGVSDGQDARSCLTATFRALFGRHRDAAPRAQPLRFCPRAADWRRMAGEREIKATPHRHWIEDRFSKTRRTSAGANVHALSPLRMTLTRPPGKRAFDLAAKDHRAVVGLVARTIDECHRPDGCAAYELGQGLRRGMFAQFAPIARGKLVPARRVVSEPAAQFGAGRDVLEPGIELEIRLAH